MGPFETKQTGEFLGDLFLDDGQGGRDRVDVDVGVERGEEHLGDDADGGGAAVELVEEALVPGVDAVGEDLRDGLQEPVFAGALGGGEQVTEMGLELCGWEEVPLN